MQALALSEASDSSMCSAESDNFEFMNSFVSFNAIEICMLETLTIRLLTAVDFFSAKAQVVCD